MGSIVGTVGDKVGLRLPIAAVSNLVITSLAGPYPAANATNLYTYAAFEFGWRAFAFQLVPGTSGTLSAAVNVTLDQATAQGVVGANLWEQVPPTGLGGAGGFINPMTQAAGTRLLFVASGPWAAFQVVVTGAPTGGAAILFSAGS